MKRTARIEPDSCVPVLDPTRCDALQNFIRTHIPLARDMDLSLSCQSPDQLRLLAPLAPNINDKGTAFGGSQAALATLAAWGLVWLAARQQDWNVDIVVARSEQTYRRPIESDLLITAQVPASASWLSLWEGLTGKGRGRIAIDVEVRGVGDHRSAMNFKGLFVAIANEE